MDNIICRLMDLPGKVNAVTMVDENGDYNIYVNSHLSREEQRRAYRHEERHIYKGHFYTSKAVSVCEREADVT